MHPHTPVITRLHHVQPYLSDSHSYFCRAGTPTAIYSITNSANRRIYVGRSTDVHARFRQHALRPNRRMAADVARFQPYADFFILRILETLPCNCHRAQGCNCAVDASERRHIRALDALGPKGYNSAPGSGATSASFRYLFNRGLLRRGHT